MKKNNLNISERAKNGRNGVQLVYVLDCIRNSSRATDEGKEFANDFEVLKFFFDTFNEEFNNQNNKRLYPNMADRIGQYLQGLPSCCNIDYWNDEIIKLGVSWCVLDQTEGRKAEKFASNFFTMCGLRILQAAQKVGLNPYQWAV
jgi:hypothetical protein